MYDFIAIDFETATAFMNSACSIGIACVSNFEIVNKKYYLIQPPENKYNPYNSEIHGLTACDTQSAPKFPDIWPEICDLFNDCIVVAHNAQFDMSVLYNCLKFYNLQHADFSYIDSISIASHIIGNEISGRSLEECAKFFNIELKNHHNALDDAITCAEIVIESIKASNRKSLKTYCSSYCQRTTHVFSDLNPTSKMYSKSKYKTVKVSDIQPASPDIDTSHPCFGKNFVLTGELETLTRTAAMQKIVDVGGIIKSSVSAKVHYLVVGKQDLTLVGSTGISTKERKAQELINKGIGIKIINEESFLELFKCPQNDSVEQTGLSTSNFYDELKVLLEKIILEKELPESSLHIYSNISRTTKDETSKSICIYEPEFPEIKRNTNDPKRNFVVMNIRDKDNLELLIRKTQFSHIDSPATATIKEVPSDENFTHVFFKRDDPNIFDYIKQNIYYCLKYYESKAKTFGCCNKFMQCSDAKKCVHENKLYSMACSYRHSLDAGRIFYGKNRNVD